MLYIASDHGGFNLKKELTDYFLKQNIAYEDLGPEELVPEDDYTEYVLKIVEKVRSDENSQGIIICRNGVGVSILANKFKDIRAALSFDVNHAKSTKVDDNANILTLPADYIDSNKAKEIVTQWLATPFSNADRHVRRLQSDSIYGQE